MISHEGKQYPAVIVIESDNGRSVAVQLDAENILWTTHGFALAPTQIGERTDSLRRGEYSCTLLLSKMEDGSYLEIITDITVGLERA